MQRYGEMYPKHQLPRRQLLANEVFHKADVAKRTSTLIKELELLYPEGKAMTELKNKDLLSLLDFIPPVHHHFYKHLRTAVAKPANGAPVEKECRNVLTESARIARGNVKPLNLLNESCADAIVFPGGFGAAKNLSDFALKGADCSVNDDVTRVLKEFHKARKPIGLCCIAPVLAAKILGNVVLTLGKKDGECWPHSGAIEQAEKMGAKMEFKNVDEIAVDTKNNIITTPAFMFEGKFHEIYDGIGLMIKELVCRIK
ncbi:ES1-like protein, mitochondrial [Gryllus bimaculatus]|nr:ES1-like protein, mitochondrial [Gryllus bimaculatus]